VRFALGGDDEVIPVGSFCEPFLKKAFHFNQVPFRIDPFSSFSGGTNFNEKK